LLQTIYSVLCAARRYSGSKVALLGIQRKLLTRNGLVQQIERTVDTLTQVGVGRGDKVAIALENGPAAAACCVAVPAAATATPLNIECAAPQFHEHLSALSPKALFVTPSERKERLCLARDPSPVVPGVPVLSKSDDYLRELTLSGMKQTIHDRRKKRNERRKEPRIQINQEVTVTLLGGQDSPPFRAVAEDMSGSGMRILSQHPVPYQTVVKVEMRDLLLLGEVIRVQVCDRGNVVALKFWHSL
jgi:hypothetical protein